AGGGFVFPRDGGGRVLFRRIASSGLTLTGAFSVITGSSSSNDVEIFGSFGMSRMLLASIVTAGGGSDAMRRSSLAARTMRPEVIDFLSGSMICGDFSIARANSASGTFRTAVGKSTSRKPAPIDDDAMIFV